MKSLARLHVWWPEIDSDIEQFVACCNACQQQRPQMPKVPVNPWLWPTKPWQRIHIDYAGPFWDTCF